MKERYFLLAICDAGAYLEGTHDYGTCSCTTYSSRLEDYFHRLTNGGVVLDKRPVMERNPSVCIHEVCSGPMVDVRLPVGTVHGLFSNPEKISSKWQKLRSLDQIDLHTYAARWWELGARVGVRKGKEIVWDDGSADMIFVPVP